MHVPGGPDPESKVRTSDFGIASPGHCLTSVIPESGCFRREFGKKTAGLPVNVVAFLT